MKSTSIRESWFLCYLWTLEHFQVCSVPASHACRIYFILCLLQLWFPKLDSMTPSGFVLWPVFTLNLIAILHDLVFILHKLRWHHYKFPILQNGAKEIIQQLFTLGHGLRLEYSTDQLCLWSSFCQHCCLSRGCYSHRHWMQPWQESPSTNDMLKFSPYYGIVFYMLVLFFISNFSQYYWLCSALIFLVLLSM